MGLQEQLLNGNASGAGPNDLSGAGDDAGASAGAFTGDNTRFGTGDDVSETSQSGDNAAPAVRSPIISPTREVFDFADHDWVTSEVNCLLKSLTLTGIGPNPNPSPLTSIGGHIVSSRLASVVGIFLHRYWRTIHHRDL